jgi:hypothetical protein
VCVWGMQVRRHRDTVHLYLYEGEEDGRTCTSCGGARHPTYLEGFASCTYPPPGSSG